MSILDDLANELGADVEAVRAALLSGGDSESLTPNYLTTDAAGKVGASFTGKVTARGLLLPQTSVSTDSRVSWRSDLDNSEMGFAVVQESGGTLPTHNVQGTVQTQGDDSGTTNLSLIAQSQGGSGNVSKIVLDTGLTGGLGIQARVLGITKSILKPDGRSDFLQLLTQPAAGLPGYSIAFGNNAAFGPVAITGGADLNVPLGFTWPNSHKLFIATIWANSSWTGVDLPAAKPGDTSNGQIHIINSSVSQTFIINWLSIGN